MKKIILCLSLAVACTTINAQKTKPSKKTIVKKETAKLPAAIAVPTLKIIMDEKEYAVKGELFNTANYMSDGKVADKTESYYYKDKTNLVITDVETGYKWNDGVKLIKTYTIPLAKLIKKSCYNISMEADDFEGGKYERLTLLAATNQNDFKESSLFKGDDKPTVKMVSNVTINIGNKADAEKWLTLFIK
jgi:hypothetical protein